VFRQTNDITLYSLVSFMFNYEQIWSDDNFLNNIKILFKQIENNRY